MLNCRHLVLILLQGFSFLFQTASKQYPILFAELPLICILCSGLDMQVSPADETTGAAALSGLPEALRLFFLP